MVWGVILQARIYVSEGIRLGDLLEGLAKAIAQDFERIDFLLVRVHPDFPIKEINPALQAAFPGIDYVAFDAIDAFADERIIEQGVVACVFRFERQGRISRFWIEDIRGSRQEAALAATAEYLNRHNDRFHVMIAGLAEGKIGSFLEALSERLEYAPLTNIIGGLSTADEKRHDLRTAQFVKEYIIRNGFVILSFEQVLSTLEISLGFRPYGITYEISRVEGGRVYSVDYGRSFSRVMQKLLEGIEKPKERYLWYTPVYILDEDDGATATLRTPVHIGVDHVEFFAPLHTGQRIKLAFATWRELLEADRATAKRVLAKMDAIEIIFDFSCVARQYVMEAHQADGNATYTRLLRAPLFGFFTFGEIGPDRQRRKLKLYNGTSLVVGLRER